MAEGKDIPAGFRLPLYRALTEKMLMGGAPKEIMILNGTMAVIFMMMHTFWVLILNVVIHVGAIRFTKSDDQFFDCFKRYINKKNYYST